jgi:thiamine-monophosphate kinase
MMDEIIENRLIARIAGSFRKAPHKLNDIHETDAEIIDLGKGCENYLVITTDALVEEISSGLYDDPYLIGWMLAMVNFSDLAAVGADPLGLLVAVNYATGQDDAFLDKLSSGISDACERLGTFVLGGDTNQGRSMLLCGTAVGTIPKQKVIRRVGATPKDKLYLTAPAGLGNVYAFLRLVQSDFKIPQGLYQPVARIAEGRLIRQFATCCMDTSDGVVHTVDTLMRLNHCQIVLDADWEKTIHPFALQVCRSQNFPPWLVLAAVHGEFELCFTVGPQKEDEFLLAAKNAGWAPVLIGVVDEGEGVSIRTKDKKIPVDTAAVRNLSEEAGSNPMAYIKHLMDIAHQVGL